MGMLCKQILRWGYDHLWTLWPVMLIPLVMRFRQKNGYWPHVFRPRTFNEKILWRMLFDRRAIYGRVSGKFECREFVHERVGGDALLVPMVGMIRDPADLQRMALPEKFILKINDGSGLRHTHPKNAALDRDALAAMVRDWLGGNFAKYAREWAYTQVEHAVIAEQFVGADAGTNPIGMKLNCFDGRVRYLHYNEFGVDPPYHDNYDRHWSYLPFCMQGGQPFGPRPRPAVLDEAIRLAELISAGFDHLRVDFHVVGNRLWLAELTTLHSSGIGQYGSFARDLEIGRWWTLPEGVGPISALIGGQPDVGGVLRAGGGAPIPCASAASPL